MKKLISIYFLFFSLVASGQMQRIEKLNLDHFSVRVKNTSVNFEKYLSGEFLKHPELGLLPFNGPPCDNCIERIDKRDAFSRFFIDPRKGGNSFIQEVANSPINYLDEEGRWMEINHRLVQQNEKLFVSSNQPCPVQIDLSNRIISIGKSNQQIQTEIPSLFWLDANGIEHSLGSANLNSITAGDDGVKITDIYPGIDLIISLRTGEVETDFILNNRLPFSTGTIILKQPIKLNEKLRFYPNTFEVPAAKEIFIQDEKNITAFTIEKGYAFSSNHSLSSLKLQSKIAEGNILEFFIPTAWLNDPTTTYPVVIDPLITSSNTLPAASIAGTRYSPVCWTNGCDYFLTVPTPPNTTITGIYHSFEYFATGLCFSDDGGYSIDYLGCHSPAGAPGVFTDPSHLTNFTFTADTVLLPEFNACFPAPQCASQNLNFTLHFFRCNNDPDTTCSGSCIRATQPWIMFVEGNTLEISSITAASFICEGSGSSLAVTPQYGVAPYSYLWSPGGATTDTLTVFPTSTTNYAVTVTDACGTTSTASTTVFVTNYNNPGFTVTPNPVCENSPVNLNANGAASAANYDWIVSGSNAAGGIVNDNQNPVVNYNLPGVYDVILSFGSCGFQDTVQLTVDPMLPSDVSITAQPSLTICTGDAITFHALPVNGGIAAQYTWLVDSILMQNGTTDSLVTSILNNGSSVQVIMQSNSTCTSNTIDTATVFIAVSSSLTPQVTISPDTIVCPGSPLTLNTTAINEGSAPLYQWYANGLPIAGANSSSYTFAPNPPDTIISVEVTSSFSCVTTPMATDSTTINFFTNIFAGVALTANPVGTICSGDSIVYTAFPVNGGSNPQFDWYVNGVLIISTDSVFSYFPANNDSISVLMTSSIACATLTTDDDYNIASVSASVSPSVNISAAPSTSVCQGDTVSFTASAINAGSNPTYAWTVNGNPVGINDSLLTYFSFSDNDIVQVIVSSSLNCAPIPSDTDNVIITVIPNVSPSISLSILGGTACEGSPVQLISTLVNGGASPSIQWDVNGVSTGLTNDTIILTTLNSGDTIEVFMTSSIACVSPTGTVSATYIAALQPRVTPDITIIPSPIDSVCLGQSVEISATTINGGNIPNIRWYVNGILTASNTNFLNGITFSQGDIIVANLVSSEQCLTNPVDTSNFVRIFYRSPLNVTLTSGLLGCTGAPTTVRATASGGTGGPYLLRWSDGSTGIDSITVMPGNNTIITVQAEDNCTAISASDTLYVPVLPSPVADYYYYNPYEGAFLNTIQFVNNSTNANSLIWYFPDSNTTSTDINPIHTFPRKGTYEIKLFTENNSGCTDSITYIITVGEETAVFYPNSFTPNGDGNNDYFRPIGASIEDYELLIYNRWGQVIYRGDNKSVWDGRINNTAVIAPEGVYVFRIELKFASRADEIVTGRVTLIR